MQWNWIGWRRKKRNKKQTTTTIRSQVDSLRWLCEFFGLEFFFHQFDSMFWSFARDRGKCQILHIKWTFAMAFFLARMFSRVRVCFAGYFTCTHEYAQHWPVDNIPADPDEMVSDGMCCSRKMPLHVAHGYHYTTTSTWLQQSQRFYFACFLFLLVFSQFLSF